MSDSSESITLRKLAPSVSDLYGTGHRKNQFTPGLVPSFGITVTYLEVSGCGSETFIFNFGEENRQVFASESPLKRRSRFLVPSLKGQQALFQFLKGVEVVGCEHLPLDNGEVNLNLIEPTGMHRGMYEEKVGPLRAEAVHGSLAAVSGAVVHDPEDAPGGFIGLLAHDLLN